MATFLITTTGTPATVTFNDLGERSFVHPVTNYNLLAEYTIDELRASEDVGLAITNGEITATYNGIAVTASSLTEIGSGDMTKSVYDTNSNNIADKAASVDDGAGNVTSASSLKAFIDSKGQALGLATLDAAGLIPSTQLPSFVDDVLEYANLAAFPVTGETGKIYVALDTNKTYRWSGSAYVYITSGAVDSVNGQTGVVVLTTTNVNEGTNLYYTDERVDDRVAALIQNGTGITWTYVDGSGTLTANVSLSAFSTTNLSEGTNLYFTEARVRSTVLTGLTTSNTVISATDSVLTALGYLQGQISSVTSTLTETVQDIVGAFVTNSSTLSWTYNDAGNTLSAAVLKVPNALSQGTGITTFSFDGSGTATVAIANTGVTATSYGSASSVATFTVNAQGQLTTAATTAISITASQVSDFTEAAQDAIGGALTNSASIVWTYSDAGNTISAVAKKTWSWGGARNSNNTTNVYLRSFDGLPGNTSTYVAPFACKIRTVSASTNGNETWTAQVRVNGVAAATVSITAAASGQSTGLNVSVAAGDKVSFYCNGTSIDSPMISAIFEEA